MRVHQALRARITLQLVGQVQPGAEFYVVPCAVDSQTAGSNSRECLDRLWKQGLIKSTRKLNSFEPVIMVPTLRMSQLVCSTLT